jgi:hypothetical protein
MIYLGKRVGKQMGMTALQMRPMQYCVESGVVVQHFREGRRYRLKISCSSVKTGFRLVRRKMALWSTL